MSFDHVAARMRALEAARDPVAPLGVWLAIRLDGRGFTRLTKEVLDLERPFDERFHSAMITTVQHLFTCGLNVRYGYTQSDEVTLVLDAEEQTFGRRYRKLLSILAGEASAAFSVAMGTIASFDSRVVELPGLQDVIDNLRWRAEDARRNCVSAHCYWALRSRGMQARRAADRLRGLSTPQKLALLLDLGIEPAALPSWQCHGTGMYWKSVQGEGCDPRTGARRVTVRRRLHVDEDLPAQDSYSAMLERILGSPSDA